VPVIRKFVPNSKKTEAKRIPYYTLLFGKRKPSSPSGGYSMSDINRINQHNDWDAGIPTAADVPEAAKTALDMVQTAIPIKKKRLRIRRS